MPSELCFSSKTVCRIEVLGKVSSLAFDLQTNACLAVTIMNGAHVLNLDDPAKGVHSFAAVSAYSVESYPYHCYGGEPLLSGCFLNDQRLALGSSTGTVSLLSRRSHTLVGHYTVAPESPSAGEKDLTALPIRTLHAVPHTPTSLLLCVRAGATVVDVERCAAREVLENLAPRAVAAVPLAPENFLVANYDGKVLLYDTRYGPRPHTVLSIPDQITSLAACPETAGVCAATVAGRVFTLRCTRSALREQAFAMGRRRSPIRAVAVYGNAIAAGDLLGRLALLDASDVPNPTKYWIADVSTHAEGLPSASPSSPARGERAAGADDHGDGACERAEVTAVTLAQGVAWAAFTSANSLTSQVVAVPA